MSGPRIPTDEADDIENIPHDDEDEATVSPDVAGAGRGEDDERVDIEGV